MKPYPDLNLALRLEVGPFFFKDFIYLFKRERERERAGRDTGRGRSRLHARTPMRDSIPGPRGPALSRRRTLRG